MKKIFILYLLVVSLAASAQTDTTKIEIVEPPDSTAIGTPDGKLISKQIGPTGGAITSDDGRVELIFPQGALTTNTTISIQPTTNPAPNGAGKAYQFEPSGTHFKKPVQLILHYTDEEAETCPPELMGIAMQDHKGKWTFFDYEDYDSTAKILSGFIEHFSGLTNVYKLKLECDKEELGVNGETQLRIADITRKYGDEAAGLEGQYKMGRVDKKAPVLFYVNGIENGNRSVGSIAAEAHDMLRWNLIYATFTAPKFLLKQNPVTVRADVYVYSGKKKIYHNARSLRCKITIFDAYKIKVISNSENRAGMNNIVTDSGSFVVYVYPTHLKIEEIKNYKPTLTKEGRKAGCKLNLLTDNVTGVINITDDYRNYNLSLDSPPEVLFGFATREVLDFRFTWTCKGLTTEPSEIFRESVPEEINFIANGEEQHIRENNGVGSQYSVVVKPYRRE